jgi:hypothetical protein
MTIAGSVQLVPTVADRSRTRTTAELATATRTVIAGSIQ